MVLVRVILGGTVVGVGVNVGVKVLVCPGVLVGTGDPLEQLGVGVWFKLYNQVETGAPW